MTYSFFKKAVLAAAVTVGLAGCSSYGRGYSSVGLGYGTGGYYAPGAFGGVGSGYGWYDDFYYPGTGYYVYNRAGQRTRWNDNQRRYWQGRQYTLRDREDVRDFRQFRREGVQDRRAFRAERAEDRAALRSGAVTRDQFRADRQVDRRAFRQDQRSDRRAFRRDLRDRPAGVQRPR